jgi:threonine dehydrogenase-like Zn-dependent dehydrogenase
VKALSVRAGVPASGAVLDDAEEPAAADAMIVETRLVGICGTDVEIVQGVTEPLRRAGTGSCSDTRR